MTFIKLIQYVSSMHIHAENSHQVLKASIEYGRTPRTNLIEAEGKQIQKPEVKCGMCDQAGSLIRLFAF